MTVATFRVGTVVNQLLQLWNSCINPLMTVTVISSVVAVDLCYRQTLLKLGQLQNNCSSEV